MVYSPDVFDVYVRHSVFVFDNLFVSFCGAPSLRACRQQRQQQQLSPAVQAVLVEGHPHPRAGPTEERLWSSIQRGFLSSGTAFTLFSRLSSSRDVLL